MLFYTITEITEDWKILTNGPESIIFCVSNVSLFFIHCLSKGWYKLIYFQPFHGFLYREKNVLTEWSWQYNLVCYKWRTIGQNSQYMDLFTSINLKANGLCLKLLLKPQRWKVLVIWSLPLTFWREEMDFFVIDLRKRGGAPCDSQFSLMGRVRHKWSGSAAAAAKRKSDAVKWPRWSLSRVRLFVTLCDSLDCSLPGSSVHGILQARIWQCVADPCSRRPSQPGDGTWVSSTAGWWLTFWASRRAIAHSREL